MKCGFLAELSYFQDILFGGGGYFSTKNISLNILSSGAPPEKHTDFTEKVRYSFIGIRY